MNTINMSIWDNFFPEKPLKTFQAPYTGDDPQFKGTDYTASAAEDLLRQQEEEKRVGLNTGTADTNDASLLQGRGDAERHAKEQRNRQKIQEYTRQLELALKTGTTPPARPDLEE